MHLFHCAYWVHVPVGWMAVLLHIWEGQLQVLAYGLFALTCDMLLPLHANVMIVDSVWNVMSHAQKPDFVFRAKRTSPSKSAGGRQFSRLLAAEVCASAVVMLGTPCSEVVWRVLATHSIHQFPLHFPSRASPCAITFQLDRTSNHTSAISYHSGIKSHRTDRGTDNICNQSTIQKQEPVKLQQQTNQKLNSTNNWSTASLQT